MKPTLALFAFLAVLVFLSPSVTLSAVPNLAKVFDYQTLTKASNIKAQTAKTPSSSEQTAVSSQTQNGKAPGGGDKATAHNEYLAYVSARSSQVFNNIYNSIIVAVLAVVSLVVALRFLARSPSYTATNVVQLSALISLIYGTIILVLVSTTEGQLTAAIGVLGAIGGYIFGSARKDSAPAEKNKSD